MTAPSLPPALIDGAPVPLATATRRAAEMLAAASRPVFAGLGTDVAGLRAVLGLAERLDGTVDHMRGAALARETGLLAEGTAVFVTPEEARARADVVVLAGDLAAAEAWIGRVFAPGPAAVLGEAPVRSVVLLGAFARAAAAVAGGTVAARAGDGPGALAAVAAAVRARLAGRAVDTAALADADRDALDAVIAALTAARYGVVLCDAATFDALTLELLAGLVADLNLAGRFALLPFPGDDDAAAAVLVGAWTTGFAPPIGFRGGVVRRDAWEYSARRMIESGEADLLVWISSMSPTAPAWTGVPTISLVADGATAAGLSDGTAAGHVPEVAIAVAAPAAGSVVYDADAAALVALAGPAPGTLPTVASVLAEIAAALPGGKG